jgi:hypothetical protein
MNSEGGIVNDGRARLRRAVTRFAGKHDRSAQMSPNPAQYPPSNPQPAIGAAPSNPVKPCRTPSNPVKPGQTNLQQLKNPHCLSSPPPVGNQYTLASEALPHSPFPIHYSLFTIHYSLFTIHYSKFTILLSLQPFHLFPPVSTWFHLIPLNSTSGPPGGIHLNIVPTMKLAPVRPISRHGKDPFSTQFQSLSIKVNQG